MEIRSTTTQHLGEKFPIGQCRAPRSGEFEFFVDRADEWLFTENETNGRRLYNLKIEGHFKDAFHEYVVKANSAAVNLAQAGTKTAAHIIRNVPAGSFVEARACLRAVAEGDPFEEFDDVMRTRRAETDAYYAELQKDISDPDARLVQRQALAGMIWSKQYFYYDLAEWLHGDPQQPPPPSQRLRGRNFEWQHLDNDDVISMPDKWEYPWYQMASEKHAYAPGPRIWEGGVMLKWNLSSPVVESSICA